MPNPRPRNRLILAAAAVVTLAVGLLLHFLFSGPLVDFATDALYTVLIAVVVAFVAPGIRSWLAAGIALALSVAVELLQLTPFPAELARAVPLSHLVFGSTFSAPDLLFYAIGAAAFWCADAAARRNS